MLQKNKKIRIRKMTVKKKKSLCAFPQEKVKKKNKKTLINQTWFIINIAIVGVEPHTVYKVFVACLAARF